MTLDDAVAEVDLCYPTIEDHGEERSLQAQRVFKSLNGIQEKIFELTDNLPLRKSIGVVANIKRKR